MISSKFNLIFGAAIFASTVYFLWIKIKRKSVSTEKDNVHNIDELKDDRSGVKKQENDNINCADNLNSDNLVNNTKFEDILNDELLCHQIDYSNNLDRENIYDNDINDNIVITDNFIVNDNNLSVQQIDNVETVAENHLQIIGTSISNDNNANEEFFIEDNNNQIENKIKFFDNLIDEIVKNKIEIDSDMINTERSTNGLFENVLNDIETDENVTNKINTQELDEFDKIRSGEQHINHTETNYSLNDENIAIGYNKPLIIATDAASVLFEIKTGDIIEDSFPKETEINLNQIQHLMSVETCIPISNAADTRTERNQSFFDKTEISFLTEIACPNELETPLDIESENIEMLINNSSFSQITEEISKIENKSNEKEINNDINYTEIRFPSESENISVETNIEQINNFESSLIQECPDNDEAIYDHNEDLNYSKEQENIEIMEMRSEIATETKEIVKELEIEDCQTLDCSNPDNDEAIYDHNEDLNYSKEQENIEIMEMRSEIATETKEIVKELEIEDCQTLDCSNPDNDEAIYDHNEDLNYSKEQENIEIMEMRSEIATETKEIVKELEIEDCQTLDWSNPDNDEAIYDHNEDLNYSKEQENIEIMEMRSEIATETKEIVKELEIEDCQTLDCSNPDNVEAIYDHNEDLNYSKEQENIEIMEMRSEIANETKEIVKELEIEDCQTLDCSNPDNDEAIYDHNEDLNYSKEQENIEIMETIREIVKEHCANNINQLDDLNDNQQQLPVSQDVDLSSDISQNSDYIDDSLLTTFMEYVEECLNENESKEDENDSNSKIENWPNDDDSLNDIKRDFYEMNNMICSPHPSSESDHAHCVNNLTERVAILSAESILDNQCHISSSDSEMTPTLNSPIFGYSNPELYVEKITYGGKELDVVYFEEALLEEGGVHPDVKIIRTIPVGLGGRIIGKKGKTKNELMKKYGAQLLIYNHPVENGKQVLEITCSPSVRIQLENWVNKTLDQITKNTLQTTVSNPEWLKPMIPLGKLVAAHIVDMPTIQHIKLRIFDPEIIKEFNKMQLEMNIDYSSVGNTALLPRPVAIGCVCIAMIRPDYFLRAQIVDIYEDIAWVYLFDLGKVCQTYLYYLFKIREKYMRVPFQTIPARIPNATIKNNNITPEIIFKRFLCNQSTLQPTMVRVFFPRMHTCCEPCVNIYIPSSTVCRNENNEEFVDLLELLVSIGLCSMTKISVDSKTQSEINSNHVKAFMNEKSRKASVNSTVPVYFQPCNSKFYEDFIEFKPETDSS